jgi:P pilus assembly chaperone PapD
MKKILIILFLFLATSVNAQVVITPYVVLIDNHNKFGTYTVINQTNEEQEVSINFQFGYPISDEDGNVTMKYEDVPTPGMNALNDWLKIFPKRFLVKPGEKQVVRMTVDPPANLAPGTYWTRMVTSTQTKTTFTDTTKNLSAKINFILNQITTVIYKNKKFSNNINYRDLVVNQDTASVNFISDLSVTGDQPFFAKFEYQVLDNAQNVVYEREEFASVYFDMKRKYQVPIVDLPPGNYTLNVKIISDDNSDIPKNDNYPITPIQKSISFTIQ